MAVDAGTAWRGRGINLILAIKTAAADKGCGVQSIRQQAGGTWCLHEEHREGRPSKLSPVTERLRQVVTDEGGTNFWRRFCTWSGNELQQEIETLM